MGCILVVLAGVSPRFVLLLLWIFGSDRLDAAYDSFLLGLAGFLLLPYTTACYAIAYQPGRGVSGIGWVVVAVAVLADLGTWGKAGREGQVRYA